MVPSGREFRVVSPSEPREIDFRQLASADLPMLAAWLAEPHVRTFYQKTPVSLEEVALEYGPVINAQEPTLSHLALSQGQPFAYLQCYRNADYPDWAELIKVVDGISIDLFIGDPSYLQRGFGQAALRAYLRRVAFAHHTAETRAYISHELTNIAALRCSQAVGFRLLRSFLEGGIETMLLVVDKP